MLLRWWRSRRKKLSAQAERRLLIVLARAEEEVVRTHVQNALDVIDALASELPKGRALELYLAEQEIADPYATIITQRVLSRLERAE